MGKRLKTTPRGKIRAALRQLWLRSRERSQCLKDHNYTCVECNTKQSVAKGREVKVQVDHIKRIDWEGVIDIIIERLLSPPQQVLCKDCHEKKTKREKL